MFVPENWYEVWSAYFMTDALYHGTRFPTFNVINNFNQKVVAIEVDTSRRAERTIQILDHLTTARELPLMLRVDNGPELLV